MIHGLQLINRYSGLPGTVVSWDFATDTVIVRLACGQEANYSILDIALLWQIKNLPTAAPVRTPDERKENPQK
jgi:hypothetical protein